MPSPEDTTDVGTPEQPQVYPPWVITDDAKRRWNVSRDVAMLYFQQPSWNPTVRFYQHVLYFSAFPLDSAAVEQPSLAVAA